MRRVVTLRRFRPASGVAAGTGGHSRGADTRPPPVEPGRAWPRPGTRPHQEPAVRRQHTLLGHAYRTAEIDAEGGSAMPVLPRLVSPEELRAALGDERVRVFDATVFLRRAVD